MRLPHGSRWLLAALFIGMFLPMTHLPTDENQLWAEIIEIPAARDNTLIEHPQGALSNGSGSRFFAGRTNQQEGRSLRRGLIQFDIAGEVPQGATITDVSLNLHVSDTRASSAPVDFHRLLADWGEGASDALGEEGSGATAMVNDATWLHTFSDTSTWNTPGGDFVPTSSGTVTISSFGGTQTWGDTSLLAQDVQLWLDDPSMNFGWLLKGDETTNFTAFRFDSRENGNEANRPFITVEYTTVPEPSTVLLTLLAAGGMLCRRKFLQG